MLFRSIFLGAIFGLVLALLGLCLRFKRLVAQGIMVQTEYLQHNRPLMGVLKQLRPFHEVRPKQVHKGWSASIRQVDQLVGQVIKGPPNTFGEININQILQAFEQSRVKAPTLKYQQNIQRLGRYLRQLKVRIDS